MIFIKLFRYTVFLMLCITYTLSGDCQNATFSLPYTHYTVADGLAQMQIRALYADRDGLLWIGTQGGISLYDGTSVRTFQDVGPLSEEYILSIVRGSKTLFVSTMRESYVFDGVDGTPLSAKTSLALSHVLFEDGRHNVWFRGKDHIVILKPDGIFYKLSDVYPNLKDIDLVEGWGHYEWANCFLLDKKNRFYTFDPQTGKVSIDSLTFSDSDNVYISLGRSAEKENLIIHRRLPFKNDLYFTVDLFRLLGDTLIHVATLDQKTSKLHALSPHAPGSYEATVNDVRKIFMLHDSVYESAGVPEFNHSRFLIESGHKIYLATDEGLIVIHNDGLENMNFPACDYPWSVMPGQTHDIYVSCYKSGIFHLEADGKFLQHFGFPIIDEKARRIEQVLTNYLVTPEARMWGSNAGFLSLKNNTRSLDFNFTWYATEALAINPKDLSIYAASDTIYRYTRDLSTRTDTMVIADSVMAGGTAHDIMITPDEYLWIAGPGGVQRIHPGTRMDEIYTLSNGKLPCRGAVTLEMDKNGNIWSGGTCGLMVLRKDAAQFEFVLPEIFSQRVNQVSILKDNRLVCTSNNNLYILNISGDTFYMLNTYNRKNGLKLYEPSENGNSITQDRYVWLPSVSGIQRLDLQRVPTEEYTAKLVVTGINGRSIRFIDTIPDTLSATGHATLLDLTTIDHSGREWKYQFSLNGNGYSPWQMSSEILVSGLQHGLNQVNIRAAWDSSDPQSYIETNALLYTSLPFLNRKTTHYILVGLIAALALSTFSIMMRSHRHARNLNRIKSDLYRNRLRTIQAYLNPHFLFNTLTRIQDHILHHDARAGNDMIVRLSRVFRRVLDIGRDEENKIPAIRLSEELELIQDIVFLNNKLVSIPFTFSLTIDPHISAQDPWIPPMLIQPFVENVFKHAFNEGDTDKIITMSITGDLQSVKIIIEDNGIGIDGTQPAPDSPSLGMKLARERMELLNALTIENHIDVKARVPNGTRVEIYIKNNFFENDHR